MAGNDQSSSARLVRPPPYATIFACIALACALIIALDVWRTATARATEMAGARIQTANLARSLAQHAHDTLNAVDTLLVSLRSSIEEDGLATTRRERLHGLIASQITSVPAMRDLMVFDARGDRLVNSGRPAPAVENIADRDYFNYHALNPDRGVHLGNPVRGKLDGTWIITLSRRIDGPGGSFAGMVEATFAVRTFRDFYETFDVGKQGYIGLNTTSGFIVTRYPSDEGQIGRNIAASIVYNDQLPTVPIGNYRSVSPVDGMDHIGSYRIVESYPLVVVVGRGVDELLAPWRTDAVIHLSASLTTSALIALLGIRFTRQLRLQHQAETDTHRRERQYRLLADNNTDLIVQLNADQRHVYASPASRSLLGYAPEDMLGARPREFAHPDDWPALEASLAAIARDGAAPPVSYRARRGDGTEIWVEAAGRRLVADGGFILVKRDITQRRSAELQLRQAQRMEAVGQLTAGVAHDFNNLLQVQLSALELLLRDVAELPQAARMASMALGAAEHAAKLTHSLLSFSRQQVLDPEPVAIPALLKRLETILSRTLGPRIALQLDIEEDLALMFADPAQTEAALLNLALNARDAMPDGGCLSIAACSATTASDVPEGLEPGKHLLIAVTDNGTGMSQATLAQACEPFFTTKGVGKGSGLGLSMVQGFARQSGGAIRFTSALGHGTRIELWLPVAATQMPGPTSAVVTRTQGRGRILLVDDVPDVLAVMTECLESSGFEVAPACDGEAALELATASQHFDILVTDFAMPGIDGAELVHRIRRMYPELPAVIVSGHAEFDRISLLPPHVLVLRKPIAADVLAGHICDLLASTNAHNLVCG